MLGCRIRSQPRDPAAAAWVQAPYNDPPEDFLSASFLGGDKILRQS